MNTNHHAIKPFLTIHIQQTETNVIPALPTFPNEVTFKAWPRTPGAPRTVTNRWARTGATHWVGSVLAAAQGAVRMFARPVAAAACEPGPVPTETRSCHAARLRSLHKGAVEAGCESGPSSGVGNPNPLSGLLGAPTPSRHPQN